MADVRRAPDIREPSATNGRRHSPSASHSLREQRAANSNNLSGPLGARGYTTLFRNKQFLRLWLAQIISQTVMNAANYGMIVLVTAVSSGSSLATSGAIVAFSLPALFLSVPAGALVDRFDRRLVLWVSNALRALASALFVLTLLIAPDKLWPVYALTFFIAMVGQFFTPAEGAAIPRLVRRGELMNALALFNITFTFAQALGLIILGPMALVLIPTFTIGNLTIQPVVSLFVIVTVFYVVCAALILSIPAASLSAAKLTRADLDEMAEISGVRRREPHANPESAQAKLSGILSDIAASWRYIRQDSILHIAAWQLTTTGVVLSVIATIAPRFVKDFFNEPYSLAALVFLPAGIGLVLGSVATPNIVRRLRYTRTIALGMGLLAASTALLVVGRVIAPFIFGPSDWSSAWPYIVGMLLLTFLIGIGLDFVNVPAQTILQDRSADWIKGRVLAVQYLMLYAVTVVYVPIIGWLADRIGLPATLIIVSLTIAVAGAVTVYLRIRLDARAGGRPGRKGGARPGAPEGSV